MYMLHGGYESQMGATFQILFRWGLRFRRFALYPPSLPPSPPRRSNSEKSITERAAHDPVADERRERRRRRTEPLL